MRRPIIHQGSQYRASFLCGFFFERGRHEETFDSAEVTCKACIGLLAQMTEAACTGNIVHMRRFISSWDRELPLCGMMTVGPGQVKADLTGLPSFVSCTLCRKTMDEAENRSGR